jgi:hypothetical protein
VMIAAGACAHASASTAPGSVLRHKQANNFDLSMACRLQTGPWDFINV